MTTKSRASDGQKNQIAAIVGALVKAVVGEVGVDSEGAQRLLANAGAFKDRLREPLSAAMREFGATGQYANETVSSNYAYPSEYQGAKPINEQVDMLAQAFELSLGGTMEFIDKVLPGLTLPSGAEGWFALPSVEAVAKRYFPNITDPAERYCRALELVIEKFKKTRKVYNYREGQLGTQYIRQQARTVQMFERIQKVQTGDIIILPAQFGLLHRASSIRRSNELIVKTENEFGFGGFQVGSMALTHPERFARWEQLHTDCPGDEYAPDANGVFSRAPCWRFNGGALEFVTSVVDCPIGFFGAVSGFLPECQS